MNPHLDQLAVGLVVAGALAYFILPLFRKRAGKGCSSGCGCDTTKIAKPLK